MSQRSEISDFISPIEAKPKEREVSLNSTSGDSGQSGDSEIETRLDTNNGVIRDLEKSLAIDTASNEERGEQKIDSKITDYFRNTLGADETIRRLQKMGEDGVKLIVKEIEAGNFRLVAHLLIKD